MRIVVVGLWHLGVTTAACMAATGARVVATDPDRDTVGRLRDGIPPVEEPGLRELIRAGMVAGRLVFEPDPATAVRDADVVWIAFDTPVDERDEADVEFVWRQTKAVLPFARAEARILVSSQVPIGFTRALRDRKAAPPLARVAYSPENLRLGRAIESFRTPARVIVGTEDSAPDPLLRALFAPFGAELLWMSLESAELTKHALNAFLATSVAFINEIARLAERHGADAKDVERGLKSEPRIGSRAYLSPGPAFAGGTLARDIRFLSERAAAADVQAPLLAAVLASNEEQGRWRQRTVQALVGRLSGACIGVLGLAYKPGTDTLRRSSSLELCRWLAERGTRVRVHDPAVGALPAGLPPGIERVLTPLAACEGAEALIVATPWPDYRALAARQVVAAMTVPRVIDESRFLADTLGADRRIRYVAVGVPLPNPEET
jgi:UDPglucose 6-dehydrogenase